MKKFYFLITIAMLFFSAQTFASLSILLVNDNGYKPERIEPLINSIEAAGFTYTLYNTTTEGASPSAALMSGFDLVIWYTGNDSSGLFFWNGDDTDNEDLKTYLDEGGMLWLQGLDFLYDRYHDTPADFTAGDFVYDYLGISQYFGQSHVDDGLYSDGVPQLDVEGDNGIFTLTPIEWTLDPGVYLYWVDAMVAAPAATGLYTLGPDGYDLSDYHAAIYNEKGDAKIMSFSYASWYVAQDQLNTLTSEGLAYFEQFSSGTGVAVESIHVYGEDNATTIEVDGGTLQMYADVLPEDATNQAVLWSIVPGTAYASIDNNGLLSAPGTIIGNGNCWVKATAADGSGVCDSIEITISNQTNNPEFEILLVNDNDYGTDRYMELDTALMNLDVNYTVYNTVETSIAPNFALLSAYDLVIWYTGNDGVGLKLWDVSDTNNYRFNEALRNYLNIQGNVWVQGLDFMYDIVGPAPVAFNSGQFVHDVMGISNYAAQSKVDDEELGCPMLDVVTNDMTTFTPINWTYETMWYVDGFELSSAAHGMYKMGPTGYVLDDYYAALYTHPAGMGFVISWAFETARLDSDSHLETVFDEVITYVKANSHTGIQEWNTEDAHITSIYPNPAQNTTTLSYQLTNNANIQFNLLDITGKSIYSENLGMQEAGEHMIEINKNKMNIHQGVYLYTLTINKQQFTGKVIFN